MNRNREGVAIVGVGQSDFAALWADRSGPRDAHVLAAEALRLALDDAGLAKSDVDGLITSRVGYERMAELTGIRRPRVVAEMGPAGRMSGVAVQHAASLIESGAADVVALVYGTDARSAGASFGGAGGYGESGATAQYDAMYGMTSPGAYVAMMYQRYAQLYGADEAALAPLAISNRRHAALTPGAIMTAPLDEAAYLDARFIAEPLRLFDYCVINDGAVVLILTSLERARTLRKRPVRIAARAAAGDLTNYYSSDDFYFASSQDVAARLYEQSGLRPDEIHCLQVYDNFTPVTLFALEGFGHAERGTAWEWVKDGRIGFDGPRPLNTSGGHTGEGYLQGWALHAEAVRQIRGEAGDRQVAGCDTAQYMCASPIVTSHILVGE